MGQVTLQSKAHPTDTQLSGWWHCCSPRVKDRELASLTGKHTADVVIVGAGFAGLSAARRLTQNDSSLKIIVLEAQGLAWAGCGRNSGFVIDLPHELNSDNYSSEREHDLQKIAQNRMAIDFVEAAAKEFGLESATAKIGKYHGATNGAGLKALYDYTKHLDDLGEDYLHLDKPGLANVIGTDYYDGGIYTPNAMLIQPAAYIAGLGQGLHDDKRAQVFPHSAVTSINASKNGVRVKTSHGEVNAGKVILANNGHIESFGIAKGRLLHLFTYASMTEQLTELQLAQLGQAKAWGLIPAAPMGSTLRKLDNGRFLIRNQWTYDPNLEANPETVKNIAKQHDRCFKARYPLLADVKMQYRWCGPIAMSLNGAPVFGEVQDNVYAATVCQGLGTTFSTLYGMMIADKICGHHSDTLKQLEEGGSPSRMPPTILNKIGVPAYLKWNHWRAGRDL